MRRKWYLALLGALGVALVLGGCGEPIPPSSIQVVNVAVPAATCSPTNQDQYVYHPARLTVLQSCIRVTGTVQATHTENDGDIHLLVALDPPYQNLLEPANKYQDGDLVVESVCVAFPVQPDALDTCVADANPLVDLPTVGQHVWLEGRFILDTEHGNWSELHPLYRWGVQQGS